MKFSSLQVMILLMQLSIAGGNYAIAADSPSSTSVAGSKGNVSAANAAASVGSDATSGSAVVSDASTKASVTTLEADPALSKTTVAPTSTTTMTTATTAPNSKHAVGGEYDEVKIQKNFIHSSTLLTSTNCKIKCLDPHAETEESAQVIDILQKIYKAYAENDLDYIGKHLAQDCITFYEGDKKVISGKQAALDDIKEWTEKESKNTENPLVEIILEHPYCNINQDHAVVTFTALKEVGGKHPVKSKSHCNDVFKKDGDTWLLLTHYRSSWKDLN